MKVSCKNSNITKFSGYKIDLISRSKKTRPLLECLAQIKFFTITLSGRTKDEIRS